MYREIPQNFYNYIHGTYMSIKQNNNDILLNVINLHHLTKNKRFNRKGNHIPFYSLNKKKSILSLKIKSVPVQNIYSYLLETTLLKIF